MALPEREITPRGVENVLRFAGIIYLGSGLVLMTAANQPVVGLVTIGAGEVMLSLVRIQKRKQDSKGR